MTPVIFWKPGHPSTTFHYTPLKDNYIKSLRKVQKNKQRLELQGLALLLLVTTQLEVLASLQSQLGLGLANNTLQSQDNLLGGLGLLVENGLGLTTVTALLTVVSSLTLGEQGSLTGLVLSDLVLGVLLAVLTLTVGLSGLWNVNWLLVLVRRDGARPGKNALDMA